jgi:2-polyprenyl-3-methyl-5-hydroxy-6-metoxy-1,4-benzoquinol methylase
MNETNDNIAGNYYNKYESQNPIARWLTSNFKSNLLDLIRKTDAKDIHELGCGEGYLSTYINEQIQVESFRASDFSDEIILTANELHSGQGIVFSQRSIYDITLEDQAQLMICCEVLEHLEEPRLALEKICQLSPEFAIFSVPREPLWRMTNMARLKYLNDLGNTPGHLQHWSKKAFITMIGAYFEIGEIRSPYPWTMLLCKPR